MSQTTLDRREFIKLGLATGTLLPVVGAALGAATARADSHGKLVTEIDDENVKVLVESLQYTNESTTEGQNCANCMLYTAAEGGRGKCTLFAAAPDAYVAEKGWCASWSKKP